MEGLLGGMFKSTSSPRAAPMGAGSRPAGAGGSTTTGRQQQLHNYTRKTLGMGFIRQAVQLPAWVDYREWLALHVQDFFDSLSLLVGVAAAADEGAPRLEPGFGFPPGYEYLWMDPRTKRPIKCSGPDYVDHVLEWVSSVINDPRHFPAPGTSPEAYPKDFEKTAKAVFKRLFRIFAILYTHYYQRMDAMGAVAHLNTSFKHFCFYIFEFDLVQNAELEAIESLVARMRQEYQAQGSQGAGAGAMAVANGSQARPQSIAADAVAAAASAP